MRTDLDTKKQELGVWSALSTNSAGIEYNVIFRFGSVKHSDRHSPLGTGGGCCSSSSRQLHSSIQGLDPAARHLKSAELLCERWVAFD